jgi:hypothetical protein
MNDPRDQTLWWAACQSQVLPTRLSPVLKMILEVGDGDDNLVRLEKYSGVSY